MDLLRDQLQSTGISAVRLGALPDARTQAFLSSCPPPLARWVQERLRGTDYPAWHLYRPAGQAWHVCILLAAPGARCDVFLLPLLVLLSNEQLLSAAEVLGLDKPTVLAAILREALKERFTS